MTSSLQPAKQKSSKQAPQRPILKDKPILKTKKRKRLFRGILLISLALHGIFLVLPWPHKSLSTSTTRLSDEANDAPLSEVPLAAMPTVSLDNLGQTSTNDEPASQRTNSRQQAPIRLPRAAPTAPAPPVQQPVQSATSQVQLQPVQVLAQQSFEPAVQPVAKPEEEITPSHSSDRVSLAVDPTQSAVMLLGEDFPDLAGAESGCYGLSGCRQLSGNYRQAAAQLLAQLEAQSYRVREIDDIDDPGHRVFEVIAPDKPNDVYYLNVYSPDAGSTVYVMAVEILDLAALEALSR